MGAIELHAKPSADYARKLEQSALLLQQIAAEYATADGSAASRVRQASSLGAEDMVLTHLISSLALDIGIFVLETGQLHPETLQLLQRLQATARVPVLVFKPVTESVVQFVSRNGADAMFSSMELRQSCCQIRKMEPLERALKGMDAWVTGLRREQSGARSDVPLRDSANPQRIKFNPLAHWTWGDVWHYIALNQLDYNPLHDQFFPSIGCAPCTRAVSLGEDFRSGRWWWETENKGGAAKECGLHLSPLEKTHGH